MIRPMRSVPFAAAYSVDLIAGDPQRMPHPVRLIGSAISLGERCLRKSDEPVDEILRGAVLTSAIVLGSWATARFLVRAGGPLVEILLGWTTLATRSLLDESATVLDALERGEVSEARARIAMIVGRDTDLLDESEIVRAVIETVAEGLCDGVAAPILYLAIGGVPLAMAYKAINTMDSMIGHPEPPYRYFGRVAARLDDFANLIPARAAALAIILAAFVTSRDARRSWLVFRRDGYLHPSPNAAQTEAAMAGALGVRLGGMNFYNGEPSPKPLLGAEGCCATIADGRAALRIAGIASIVIFTFSWMGARWLKGRT